MRVSIRSLAILAAMGTGAAVLAVGPLAVPAWAAAPTATFGSSTDFATGASPVSVALGDLNGDTVPDLATANLSAASVSVLLGDGAGGFGAPVDHTVGGDPRSVAMGDLNGDSFVDLAVANSAGSGGVSVLLGDGTGDFGTKTDYASGISVLPFSVALSDLDGDGPLDLVLADYFSSRVSVLLGDGSGAFGSVAHFVAGAAPLSVAVGDLDGDTEPDLAVANYVGAGTVSVLLGDGAGGFGAPAPFPAGSLPYSVAIGDVNGDGSADLAAANSGGPTGNGTVSVLLGDGAGSFAAPTDVVVGPQPTSVAMADLNGDSFVDLAAANRNGALVGDGDGSVSVVLGNGDGTFDASVTQPTGRYSASVAVGDLDADGRPDLALGTNTDSGSVAVLRNTTGTPAAAATPSTHLVDGQTIAVSGSGWQPGHTIGFCQAVAADPPGAGSCADGLFTEVTADSFGNFSSSLVVRASIYVPNLGQLIACTGPAQPCALGAADAANVAGTVTSVPLGFDLAVPGAPSIGAAVAGDGEATVSWTAPTFDGGSPITGYVVTPYIGYAPQPSQAFGSTATSQVVTGLANYTQYRFRVQAVNALGTGAFSTATNAVYPAPAGVTLPGAPTIGAAVAGEGEATVSWTAPISDGGSPITGYVVTAYIGYAPQLAQAFASTATTQVVTGLTNGSTYRFRVQAVNAVGPSAYSTATNAVTPATVPDPPVMGSALAGNAQASVSWTAPAFDGGSPITGYVVTPYVGAVAQTPIAFGASLTSQTITGLANGTTYTFTVAATNAVGTSAASAASNPVTPAATVPGASTIAASASSTCAVDVGGVVTCWGPTPAEVAGIVGASAIAGAGDLKRFGDPDPGEHYCAVVAGGAVTCWGNNTSGQLGDGTTVDSAEPVTVVGISGATALTAGVTHTCAIVTGGAVRCWGGNGFGQLGDGTNTSTTTPVTVTGLTGATAIAAGRRHTCAVVTGGAVRCWGNNSFGQLGTGTSANSTLAVPVSGITGATAIAAGRRHTCAVVPGGAVWCWGSNELGQLGNGTYTGSIAPVPVTGLSGATGLAGGRDHTCAVVGGGAVTCWGNNASGQLGNGSSWPPSSSVPVPVTGLTGATAVAGGRDHTCTQHGAGALSCWGRNDLGQIGNGTTSDTTSVPKSVPGLTGVAAVVAGAHHTCVLTGGGVQCWGNNWHGQLGNGTTTASSVPVPVTGIANATAISAGGDTTCALLSDGTVKCWGRNHFGQLGIPVVNPYPHSTTPVAVTGLAGATAISMSGLNACALVAGGAISCWGYNYSGQLGDGTTTHSYAPVPVTGITGATAVSAGGGHTCAVLAGGAISCWGYNGYGQLGDGTTTSSSVPVSVVGIATATAVSAGSGHTCAVVAGGAISCWGYNGYGQLGDGTTTHSYAPVAVTGITGATAVSAGGDYHTCAVVAGGAVSCWGRNVSGQLGDRTYLGSTTPVSAFGVTAASSLTTGGTGVSDFYHSCAALADGTVSCWGDDHYAQAGDVTPLAYTTPEPVLGAP